MKKRVKWTVILLLFLVYAALLLGCTNTEEPNVDNNENTSDSLETVLEPIEELNNESFLCYKGEFYSIIDLFYEFQKDRDFLLEFVYCADDETKAKFFNYVREWGGGDSCDAVEGIRFLKEYNIINMYNWGRLGTLDAYYPAVLHKNGFPSVFYKREDVRQHYNENYLEMGADELNYLPTAYYLIRDLNLKEQREEFYSLNEERVVPLEDIGAWFLLEEQFEILFGEYDEKTIMRKLKSPTAFYFDGRLYNIIDLKSAEVGLIEKMAQGEDFKHFLQQLREFQVFKEAEAEYGSLVDGWLEKYYGIKA
ncbi:MAG: hypothetical protein IKU48_00120 [Clostridia bacterium]|nr:hypothetical protein [Clostridia bacterium]